MTRREEADVKYRVKFAELGIQGFAFIRFEKKDRLWFRCLRCGYEAPRSNDIFKGRQSKLVCRQCGNGTKLHSILADEVLNYYSEGHTISETADKFELNRWQVQEWAKIRHISNGRTFEQGGRECNLKRAEEIQDPDRPRYRISYYARAKRLGLPREIGISLKKLIKRDGLSCAICGLPCIYGGDYLSDLYPSIDHIIPLSRGGGHTWSNVQVAHRICNINKSNQIGEEWHNGTT